MEYNDPRLNAMTLYSTWCKVLLILMVYSMCVIVVSLLLLLLVWHIMPFLLSQHLYFEGMFVSCRLSNYHSLLMPWYETIVSPVT